MQQAKMVLSSALASSQHKSCEDIRHSLKSMNTNVEWLERDYLVAEHIKTCSTCYKTIDARKQVQQLLRGKLL